MHVLFISPDTHVYNHGFVRGLMAAGARVSAIGPGPQQRLSPALAPMLQGYRQCQRLLEPERLLAAARELARPAFDRVETIDEPLVEPAAILRETLGLPGLPARTAQLCRDKPAMKEHLRQHDVPCAMSTRATSRREVYEFAERCGLPLILKPVAGFGSLNTYRVASAAELDQALAKLHVGTGKPVAVEEFIEGHEGFFDSIVDARGIRHDFAAHYYPGCLEATQDRKVSPQIAVTNRIEQDSYGELRALNEKVVRALELRQTATHMEWFFGPKGLKFSEIGARPAGEKIWDMHGVANDFDVYLEWALAVLGKPSQKPPSRRLSAGSVQIRPDRDGHVVGHRGVEDAFRRFGAFIYEHELPKPGTRTLPLEKGWLVNTWFRLKHPDYDELRAMMSFLGANVTTQAR